VESDIQLDDLLLHPVKILVEALAENLVDRRVIELGAEQAG
jgi:hypothetical protein